jgi:hypothetical protein
MAGLRPVSRRELIRKLKSLGFDGPFPGGKHHWMRRDGLRVTIPNPHGGAIDSGLIRESCNKLVLRLMNGWTREISINADTYRGWADDELLTCEPMKELPMAQRYFLF